MSILIDKKTRVIVQGITGRDGAFHTQKMRSYGTNIVAGVSPGKGGTEVDGIPVFNTMKEAVKETSADTSIIFVPARFAPDAMIEASEAGIKLVIAISEGVPVIDMLRVKKALKKNDTHLIGPNCPGLISPGRSMIGILPTNIFKEGRVGLISRSGTLTYEMVDQLTRNDIGQSTCIGIGGDPIAGLYYEELLEMFEKDPETDLVVLIGEIGGDAEERAASYIKSNMTKPVVAFFAGQTAPVGKQMGHAGAIISSGSGTAQDKIKCFEKHLIPVAKEPEEIPMLVKKILQS
ncbi:succinate--CoA ligase subunit alpha [Halosquirtibacter laminarini]|uniref:Succinate--CoA ligase subunit alpha n=1 Tax=Halosquirtibacter laminarini TaxID=3374600 RepID=A0AC61NK43_9BACT|nr:succinate--CoA ligase subunit alpha [Prolixibacteraceae bacterium]